MNEQDTGLMEKQYLSTEDTSEQKEIKKPLKNQTGPKFRLPNPKNTLIVAKQLFVKLKSPKILIIFLAIFIILTSLLAFLNLSSRSSYVPTVDIVDFSKTSSAPSVDPQVQDLKKQVEQYNNDLQKLNTNSSNLTFPELDLNITF